MVAAARGPTACRCAPKDHGSGGPQHPLSHPPTPWPPHPSLRTESQTKTKKTFRPSRLAARIAVSSRCVGIICRALQTSRAWHRRPEEASLPLHHWPHLRLRPLELRRHSPCCSIAPSAVHLPLPHPQPPRVCRSPPSRRRRHLRDLPQDRPRQRCRSLDPLLLCSQARRTSIEGAAALQPPLKVLGAYR